MSSLREDDTLPLPSNGKRAPGQPWRTSIRYLLLDQLAQGGMGTVFRARDPDLQRVLALKVLRSDHQDCPEMVRRFLEEARIAGQLQHPGIVPIHDMGRLADDRPFFTMKLVEGQTLSALLHARKSPHDDLPRLLSIFEQVCHAMAFAHSRGVIHRDLKPANIMVGTFGEVQVMDWGVAKVLAESSFESSTTQNPNLQDRVSPLRESDQSLAGMVVGTPAYMAPEQAAAGAVNARTDVFGLGGILCEILTAEPPYVYARTTSTWFLNLDRDLTQAYDRLDVCGADPELIALARECLNESPGDRPRDAGCVAQRIMAYRASVQERLRQAEVDRAAAEASAEAARARGLAERRAGRLLALATISLLIIVIVAGASTWFWWSRRQATEQRVHLLLAQAEQLAHQAEMGQGNDETLARWREASAAIEQAAEAVTNGWSSRALRDQVRANRQRIAVELLMLRWDRDFLERLAEIRIQKDDDYQDVDTDGRYRDAFTDYGLRIDEERIPELAARLTQRPTAVVHEIVAALDDWYKERRRLRQPESRLLPLLQLASTLDDNAWRNNLRSHLQQDRQVTTTLVTLDVISSLLVPGHLSVERLAGGIETGRRREHLRKLAKEADLVTLPATSVQLLSSLLIQEGEAATAIRLLGEKQRRHPGDVWLNHDLAQALYRQGRPQLDEAIRFYSAARAVRPEIGHALAHALQAKGDHPEAIRLFEELVRLKPTNIKHLYCLGMAYSRGQRFDEAVRHLEKTLALDPTLWQAHDDIALILTRQGKLAEAERHHREAIRLSSVPTTAFVHLGVLLYNQGKRDEAARVLLDGLKRNPRDVDALFNLGLICSDQNRVDEAIRYYRQVLHIAPRYAEAHTNLALLLSKRNPPTEAITHMQQALQYRPELEQARRGLSQLFIDRHQFAESIPHLRWTLLRHPNEMAAHARLAFALSHSGQIDEAIRVYRDAIKRFPNNAFLHYNLAHLLQPFDQSDEVKSLYQRAIAIDPGYAQAYCNLGMWMRDRGDFQAARDHLKRGHELGSVRTDWGYPSDRWLRDCEQLIAIERDLPALLSGERRPANDDETILAARAARYRGFHASSIRLILGLSFETGRQDRLELAASAILAATGASKDSDTLSPVGRLDMRRRALTWLTSAMRSSDLATRTRAKTVARDLRFARVSEPLWLAGLAEEERHAWEHLWTTIRRANREARTDSRTNEPRTR